LGTSASAAIVCNEEGDCWKVKERHTYPPDVRLHDKKKCRWREPGMKRGFWRGGVWVTF
jgi:hypothetical protein